MFSKGEASGYRSKKIDVVNRNDYEYNQAPQSNETIGKLPFIYLSNHQFGAFS